MNPGICVCALPCLTLCNPIDCSPPGSSVHGIFQARILEWVAISSSRRSSQPRDQTLISYVPCIAGGFFMCWASKEAPGELLFPGPQLFLRHGFSPTWLGYLDIWSQVWAYNPGWSLIVSHYLSPKMVQRWPLQSCPLDLSKEVGCVLRLSISKCALP